MQKLESSVALVPVIGGRPIPALVPKANGYYLELGKEDSIAEHVPLSIPRFQNSMFGPKRTRKNLFQDFTKAHEHFDEIRNDIEGFLSAVIEANTRETEIPLDRFHDDFTLATRRLRQSLHRGVELALEKPEDIHTNMSEGLSVPGELALSLIDALRRLQKLEIAGKIYWLAADVCVFNWYMWKSREERGVTRTTQSGSLRRGETAVTTVVIQELHQHQILNAKRYCLDLYSDMPKRVKNLVNAIPSWLRGQAEVVYGDEIVHDTVERVLSRSTRTEVSEEFIPNPVRQQVYDTDPAVIVGDVVLTGWRAGED